MMVIGIDIDGVLADQIAGILPKIRARHGVSLTYDEITQFRLPIGDTDIGEEIVLAMADSSYLLEMPVHRGARALLQRLKARNTVKLITARPPATLDATRAWLARHDLHYDELVSAREAFKSGHGADVLVDDYIANISEFLVNTPGGRAILVDQPWNRNTSTLTSDLDAGRLTVAHNLQDIVAVLHSDGGRAPACVGSGAAGFP